MSRMIGFFLFPILLVACGATAEVSQPTSQFATFPTAKQTSTNVPTLVRIPTTPTASATPTEPTFVLDETPAPDAEIINEENVDELVELVRWGKENPYYSLMSSDGQILFAQTDLNVTAYDVSTKELLWTFDVPAGVGGLAFDKAHDILAVGDDLGSIWLIDSVSGKVKNQWNSRYGPIDKILFSEDGDWLVAATNSFNVTVWQMPEANFTYRLDAGNYGTDGMAIVQNRLYVDNRIHELESGDLIFDAQDHRLVAVFAKQGVFLVNEGGDIVLRSLESAQVVMRFELGADVYLQGTAISEDGAKLALGFLSKGIHAEIWDISTGQKLHDVTVDEEKLQLSWSGYCFGDGPGPYEIDAVEFSENGNELSIFSGFDELIIWNLTTGAVRAGPFQIREPVYELPQIGTNGRALIFSRDGNLLASGENLWEMSTGSSHVFRGTELLSFSTDGRSVYAYQDQAILRYGLADLELKIKIPLGEESRDECSQVKLIAPNGSVFFEGGYAGGDSYISTIWELTDRDAVLREPPLLDVRLSVAFTPDGKQMIVSSHSSEDLPEITAYDLSPGREVFNIDLEGNYYIVDIAISVDKTRLVAMTWETGLVWDLTQVQKMPVNLEGDFELATFGESVTVSPEGNLVAGHIEEGIAIWDAGNGQLIHRIELEAVYSYLYDLTFSPDGRYLAGVASDGAIHVWGIPAE